MKGKHGMGDTAEELRIKELEEKLNRTPIDWDTELDALQRSNNLLRVEAERMKDCILALERENRTLINEVKDWRAEVERLKARIEEFYSNAGVTDTLLAENEDIRRVIRNVTDERNALRAENERLAANNECLLILNRKLKP